ncbi:MAG: putative sulfate exporter family transporter [Opitutales bacterium]|nr:putative sulfate exporter family transporter [Opitutales bacterium]
MNGEQVGYGGRLELARKAAFVLLAALCMAPFVSTGMALAAGIAFSLTLGNPWPQQSAKISKNLLQISVVGLGFGMNLTEVWRVGRSSLLFTALGIAFTIGTGLLIGRMMGTSRKTSALVSFGTAICGGSAIAAMSPVLDADSDENAVALATVFTLNAAALFLFPVIGHMMGLGQEQFGVWAGMAIHDTSSVVGAASAYGAQALAVGTTVKLSRAVWIAPVVMITSLFTKGGGKARVPLFIIGFIVAAALAALIPAAAPVWKGVSLLARQSLVLTLFLIGAGLGRGVLKKVGVRPLAQGVLLWIIVSVVTIEAVTRGWIC